jgi:serine/threonine-protein kinase
MTRLLNNRYEILSVIGRGGMGCVYKAADRLRAGKAVAVKELRTDRLSPEKVREALAQFQTEARILARLTHPNLPRVFDYFSLPGRSCLVMEYIAGRTLEEILAALRGKPVDERTALAWALQICRAMHFLAVQKPRPSCSGI